MRLCFAVAVVAMALSALLSGCTGARENEEILYVVALGLDKGEEDGVLKISYQIAIPRAGEREKSNELATVITVRAKSFSEGASLLKSVAVGYPTFIQTKVIIIGEDLARDGIGRIMAPLQRYREYRGSIFFLVAQGSAENVIRTSQPLFVLTPSKFYEEMMLSGTETGYFLRTTLHQTLMRLNSASGQPYAALVAANPPQNPGKGSSGVPVAGENDRKYLAGEIVRQGGNTIDFAGTAVFYGERLAGKLDTTETRMLAMLLEQFPNGYISIKDPLQRDEMVNVQLRLGGKPDIKVSFVDDRPVIKIKIMLEGEFTNISSGINYEKEKNIRMIETQINEIYEREMTAMIRHTQAMNADVAGFGYYARRSFATVKKFREYEWNKRYRDAEVQVEFKTAIRRTGLMIRTMSGE